MDKTEHIKVLIADAHPMARRGIRGVLEHDPTMQVIREASSVAEALSYMAAAKPDVVVMETDFGGESSLDRFDEIRAACPAARIVIFAAAADELEIQNVRSIGVDLVVSKRQPTSDLLAAVKTAVNGHAQSSGAA